MRSVDKLISAQVILQSDRPDAAPRVMEFFRNADFTVGSARAGSFPLSGSIGLFQRFFDVNIRASPEGAIEVITAGGGASLELPLRRLPTEMSDLVDRIIFTPLPSFGPTGDL